ncbi:hypothetical protein BUALT_Bualt01G0045900 [Buddleja alternifolia]|uniref:Uncharacterized protein n=1 Tax=Buddleja alternifolia TaxID=168488 RepID=A0AAV6YD16_9LAMI|nr:hypothetical protein BUALT_Bualt01G0045900 [Buddleja alternifolia]
MVEKSKKRNRASICEEEISALLQRYSIKTVLTLLQEVAKVAGEKIDWNAVVQNTATGISSARECQMLWRNLAYGQTLFDQFDNGANPMEDDSDLECELEAFPAPSREASAEATACVKVLIASDCPNNSNLPNNSSIEAPLTINIPSCKNSIASSDSSVLANAVHGTNICIPVYVQKQPLSSGTSGEKRPNSGTSGVNYPPRRKRRGWSTEEDMKLTAAVQKYGERNWANIARGDFEDRKASELSQRWASLRKKQGSSNGGTSSLNSEAQLAAARRAVNMALDMPMSDNWKSTRMGTVGTKPSHQSQKAPALTPNQQLATAGPINSQMSTKRPFMNPIATNSPDSMVKAAAVAAGARIATSADASSLIEATRSQNVVHIITGGSSVMKSSSNVQFMRTAHTKAPISPYSATLPSVSRPAEAQKAQGYSMKPAVQADLVAPTPVEKIPEDRSAPLGNQSKERVEKHQSCASGNALRVDLLSSEVEGKKSSGDICASKEINESPGPNGAVKQV